MKILTAALLFVCLTNSSAWTQSGTPSSVREIAAYGGPDRERLLFEGAKREGKLVWYTTLVALLFTNFLLSPEGQKLLEDLDFGSAGKDYGFKRWYPEKEGTLAQYEQALERWHKLLQEITLK